MSDIIYILLEIFFVAVVLSIFLDMVASIGKLILGVLIIGVTVFLCIKFWKTALIIIAAVVILYLVCRLVKKGKEVVNKKVTAAEKKKEIRRKQKNDIKIKKSKEREEKKRKYENYKWLKTGSKQYTIEAIDSILYRTVNSIEETDINDSEHKFTKCNIPYGRANVFLGYFKEGIESNEIYYYSCWPSKIEEEVREYGILIARSGIYISLQKKKENEYLAQNYHIPFAGLMSAEIFERKLVCKVLNMQTMLDEVIEVPIPDNIRDESIIKRICDTIIFSEMNRFMIRIAPLYSEDKTKNTASKNSSDKVDGFISYLKLWKSTGEFKNYMNGRRGGGYAAEYANNIIDRLKGKKVINAGQILDANGRQKKNGADRIVNGVEVQTKYYKTGVQSVDAAFENGVPKYIRSDGTGKMMQIEVPRDQYQEAVERMQQKINKGELKIGPKESAKDYVRKGNVTYRQAQNIACAGNLNSLTVDALGGIQCAIPGVTISMIITFAQVSWRTEDIKKAAKAAIESGIHVGITGVGTYVAIMQLKRAQLPIFDKVANSIARSAIANTSVGTKMGLNEITGTQLVYPSVVIIVKWGPDVYKALRGKISVQQLIKNSVINMADIGGYALGSLIPAVSEVTGLLGGAVAHFVVKTSLDHIMEDDSVKMYRILKEEYLEAVGIFGFSEEELELMTKYTICNDKIGKILINMYASNEYRAYARYAIMDPVIIQVLSRRNRIVADDFYNGISEVLSQVS